MKKVDILALFATCAAAHSAVNFVVFDGNKYPARETRYDNLFGAKRIEWKVKDMNGFPWMAVTDVLSPAITCGLDAQPPELTAVARAGSNVTVQWTGIITMHQGPVMTYLGAWSPGMKPQDVKFFKIGHAGYDKARHAWANEDLIKAGTADTFQLPSDIKPGLYILRTELLALHGNGMSSAPSAVSGPQFYTHCYNVDITGNGNAVPEGVTFPGSYKRDDPGVKFNLYRSRADWDNYVIPGPAVYQGKHESPVGPKPEVSIKQTGQFPAEFQAKYEAFKQRDIEAQTKAYTFFNKAMPGGKSRGGGGLSTGDAATFFPNFIADYFKIEKEKKELKAEAVRLGIANA